MTPIPEVVNLNLPSLRSGVVRTGHRDGNRLVSWQLVGEPQKYGSEDWRVHQQPLLLTLLHVLMSPVTGRVVSRESFTVGSDPK